MLFMLLISCAETVDVYSTSCEVVVESVSPSVSVPGAQVSVTGTPMTTTWDTAITLNGTRAEVISVDREGCEDCDQCKLDAACTSCEDCDACDQICKSDCEEVVVFEVPAVSPGEAELHLYNVHGQSHATPFTVGIPLQDGYALTDAPLNAEDSSQNDTGTSGDDTGAESSDDGSQHHDAVDAFEESTTTNRSGY